METYVCKKCNQEKPIDEFYKNKKMKLGHLSYCKDCSIENSKRYYNDHKDTLLPYHREKTKEYAINHPGYWVDYRKTHDEPEYVKDKRRASIRENNKNNPDYAILNSIYLRIWQAFNRNCFSKETEALFSCTKDQFYAYIKSLFTDEMAMDNYGSVWRIAHVKTPSCFDLKTNKGIHEYAHYTNLFPQRIKHFNKVEITHSEKSAIFA